jgi:hypothetical protein
MSRLTSPGRETIDRWDARTSTVWAWARTAIIRCRAGGITLSAVPTRYQLGIVLHAKPTVVLVHGAWADSSYHSVLRLCRTTRLVDREVDLGECPARFAEKRGSRGRELHAPRGPDEQNHAELTLQLPDRPRQRRLGHVQALGGVPEVQLLAKPRRSSAAFAARREDPLPRILTAPRSQRQDRFHASQRRAWR